jgi:hypothetical protein
VSSQKFTHSAEKPEIKEPSDLKIAGIYIPRLLAGTVFDVGSKVFELSAVEILQLYVMQDG